MARVTLFFGIILTVIGVAGWLVTGMASVTALIPAFFGIVFMLLGWFAYQEHLKKHLMHAAVILACVGVIGSKRGVNPFLSYMGGEEIDMPLAAGIQSVMFLLCVIYVLMGVKSFIDARKQQKQS